MIKADHLYKRTVSISEMDSVRERRKELRFQGKDPELLTRCQTVWDNMDELRQERARGKRFAYGDQWGDTIIVNGKAMTYRQYLMKTGNVALQNNLIKNRVETIVGVMTKERMEPVCHANAREEQSYGELMTATLQANCEKNKIAEVYKMLMREICFGGIAIAYESYDDISGPNRRLDSWTSYVNPNLFFMESSGVDPRGWDASLVGRMFYDTIEGIYARFAKSPSDYAILKEIYSNQAAVDKKESSREFNDKFDDGELIFMRSDDPTKCYVCEVWTKETRPKIRLWDTNIGHEDIIDANDLARRKEVKEINERRKKLAIEGGLSPEEIPYILGDGYGNTEEERNGFFMDTIWYCRMLAPDGTILWEGESPYADQSHPFSILIFPFTDGEAHGYMNDAIDMQLSINRTTILQDWVTRAQAKGVTVVPKQILGGMSPEEFARSWTSIDDMVFIDMKPEYTSDMLPKVFYGAAQTFDSSKLIAMYQNLLDKGSPATDAMQGKAPGSGTSGALYAQMTVNANTSVSALLESFHKFVESILNKKLKNIIMFYGADRYEKIAGNLDTIMDKDINLSEVGDIEYDLTIRESSSTPVARAMANQDAKEFLMAGLITMDEYLEIADVPYADKLLQKRQAQQAQMENMVQNGAAVQEEPQDNTELIAPKVRLPQPLV